METIKNEVKVNYDLGALCIVLRSLGIDALYKEVNKLLRDPSKVNHSDIIYLCREQWQLSVKKVSLKDKGLANFTKPLLLRKKDGGLGVLLSLVKDSVGVFDIAEKKSKKISYEEFYQTFDYLYVFKKDFKGGEEEDDF